MSKGVKEKTRKARKITKKYEISIDKIRMKEKLKKPHVSKDMKVNKIL